MAVESLIIKVTEQGTRIVKRNLGDVGDEARKAEGGVSLLRSSLAKLAVGTIVATALTRATRAAIQFKDALAEVNTLLDDTPGQLRAVEQGSLRLAAAYGSSATEQARAFYQAISAGASDAAEATEILDVANRLAVGGVTDVFTATDGLTSVLNAYGLSADKATDVSDALFVGMRQGKTTIDELSTSLGKVAPLAASTGVSFDELVASVAALTKGGISTREAVTGVRAILAAVAKPSSEATKLAKRLGIEFNTAALRSKGLAGFLKEVEEATGGSNEALAQLFGGVEAIIPALALSGTGGQELANILDEMTNKAGSTEEAFNKLADSPGFQLRRLGAAANAELIRLGNIIATIVAPAAKFLADNLTEIVNTLGILAVAFAATKISLFIAGLAQASAGAVLLAKNAVTLTGFIVSLTGGMGTLAGALATIKRVGPAAFSAMGGPIGLIVAAVATLIGQIQRLRGEFAALQADGANSVNVINSQVQNAAQVRIVEQTLAQERANIERLRSEGNGFVNGVLGVTGREIELRERNLAQAEQALLARRGAIESGGVAGQLIDPNNPGNLLPPPGTTTPTIDPVDIPGLGGGGGGGGGAVANVNELLETRKQLLDEIRGPQQELNLRQTALNTLFQDGSISLTEYKDAMAELNLEASALDNTISGGLLNGLQRVAEEGKNIGAAFSDFVVGAFDKASDGIVEFAKTGQFNVRAFFQDLFAQLLKLALNNIFSQLVSGFLGGGVGLGGGGGLASLFGGLLGFQNGGDFRVGGRDSNPDSQLVAFRATRGEEVSVRTPEQARAEREASAAPMVVQAEAPVVNVNVGPKEIAQALNGPEGDELIVQAVQRKSNTISKVLKGAA